MNLPTIINLPRCGGKTTVLVYTSAVDKIPILCLNKQNKKYIEDLAKKLGLSIPEPLTCHTEDLIRLGGFNFGEILIDDAEAVIPTLIGALTGAKIKGMTMSVPMTNPKQVETSEKLTRSFMETADHLAETLKKFGYSLD